MKKSALGLAVLAGLSGFSGLAVAPVMAGGIDRAALNYDILFETGRTVELSFKHASPSVKGTYAAGLGGGSTGNMAQSFSAISLGFKDDINDKLSYAIVIGQPLGADAHYASGPYTGLEAHWSTEETTALLKYKLGSGMSVYGGLRYLNSSASIVIPSALLGGSGKYAASARNNGKVGYVLGAAYEKPEIALRVSLTYTSEVTHDFATNEVHPFLNAGAGFPSTTNIVIPQTVTLAAQSGIAANTLLFGSIRWSEWSKWHVKPVGFSALSGGKEITGFDNNVISYSLGLGRKINDHLSVFGTVGYEKSTGGIASRLSPTDGVKSVSIGASWTQDKMKITGGVQYQMLGDAVDASGTEFSNNSAVIVGLKIAYTF